MSENCKSSGSSGDKVGGLRAHSTGWNFVVAPKSNAGCHPDPSVY